MDNRAIWRGKRIDNGEWVTGFYFRSKDDCLILANPQAFYALDGREWYDDWEMDGSLAYVNPDTLGQCTGLRDKNGVWIYDGDIVSVYDVNAEIKWNKSTASFYAGRQYPDISTEHLGYFEGKCKIIGNIHDNPSLLKGVEV